MSGMQQPENPLQREAADYTVETMLGPILVTDYVMTGGVLSAGAVVRLEFLSPGVYPLPAGCPGPPSIVLDTP